MMLQNIISVNELRKLHFSRSRQDKSGTPNCSSLFFMFGIYLPEHEGRSFWGHIFPILSDQSMVGCDLDKSTSKCYVEPTGRLWDDRLWRMSMHDLCVTHGYCHPLFYLGILYPPIYQLHKEICRVIINSDLIYLPHIGDSIKYARHEGDLIAFLHKPALTTTCRHHFWYVPPSATWRPTLVNTANFHTPIWPELRLAGPKSRVYSMTGRSLSPEHLTLSNVVSIECLSTECAEQWVTT